MLDYIAQCHATPDSELQLFISWQTMWVHQDANLTHQLTSQSPTAGQTSQMRMSCRPADQSTYMYAMCTTSSASLMLDWVTVFNSGQVNVPTYWREVISQCHVQNCFSRWSIQADEHLYQHACNQNMQKTSNLVHGLQASLLKLAHHTHPYVCQNWQ